MEDKKAEVLYDKDGRAYLRIIREEPVKETIVKSRIKDFVEDIVDDGKRNFSNRKKKSKKKK